MQDPTSKLYEVLLEHVNGGIQVLILHAMIQVRFLARLGSISSKHGV